MKSLEEILKKECNACDKPSKCMLHCNVDFSVAYLKEILKE